MVKYILLFAAVCLVAIAFMPQSQCEVGDHVVFLDRPEGTASYEIIGKYYNSYILTCPSVPGLGPVHVGVDEVKPSEPIIKENRRLLQLP